MMQFCRRSGLVLARLALSGLVGAAALFVINGVRLVTSDAFDSVDRDHFALVRFPAYYVMGAMLMALALLGLVLARGEGVLSPRRWLIVFTLSLLASAVMLIDYLAIYSPLAAMITPPGTARPSSFRGLHRASEIVNALQVGLCLIAAIICNWPSEKE